MSTLFATLPESRLARRRSHADAAVSVVLHAAAITLAVVATAKAGPQPAHVVEHTEVIWQPPVPTPRPDQRASSRQGGATPDRRSTAADPASDPLPPLPVPSFDESDVPSHVPPEGTISERWGRGGGSLDGRAGDGAGGPGAGDVFTGPQVERAAALHGTVAPRYPATLRERGIEGSVTLRFVVDTAGRVEPASVVVVSSTHDLFAAAARATLPTLHFTPAAAGGRRVRQLVELPFSFEIR